MNSIEVVDRIYNCSERCRLCYHLVEWPELKKLSLWIRDFARCVKEYLDDPEVGSFLREIKSYGGKLVAAPLPPSHPFYEAERVRCLTKSFASVSRYAYPVLNKNIADLIGILQGLEETSENPIFQNILRELPAWKTERIAIVLANRRAVSAVAPLIEDRYKNISVMSETGIMRGETFDRAVFTAPASWYSDAVFDSPRFIGGDIICVNWIRSKWQGKNQFVRPINGCFLSETCGEDEKADDEDVFTAYRAVDWSGISRSMLSNEGKEKHAQMVAATLVCLEGDNYVFLENEGNSKVLSIDCSRKSRAEMVQKMLVSDLKPDIHVVLRTEGGSDLLIPLADRVLGERALDARHLQKEWKMRLRNKVASMGAQAVVDQLKLYGVKHATSQNLRYWTLDTSIRTKEYSSFEALMTLIGHREDAAALWENARMIDQAHRVAGRYLRLMLLEQIKKADFEELERTGQMDFTFQVEGGGRLTAFRVKAISPDIFEVPDNRISHVFEEGESTWRE